MISMAFSINRVTLLGRCANDPEMRYTPSGQAVLNLRIATSYSYQKDGEWQEVPQFTNCVFWNKPAEIVAQHISKGDYLYVDGRVQTRSWEDQDGNTRYRTEVVVSDFVIPRNKGEGGGTVTDAVESNSGQSLDEPAGTEDEDEVIENSDIPF